MTDDLDEPTEVGYPPAPWISRGQLWVAAFTTAVPPPVPADLLYVGNPQRLLVALVRYRSGTLRYDELGVISLVRRGPRIGVWIHAIWVDDLAALWGGRRIWHLPKRLARFEWTDAAVRIRSADGEDIAGFDLRTRGPLLPAPPMPFPGFSGSPGQRLFTAARLRGGLRAARVRVRHWSDRLPPLDEQTAHLAVAVRSFRAVVPAPRPLGAP